MVFYPNTVSYFPPLNDDSGTGPYHQHSNHGSLIPQPDPAPIPNPNPNPIPNPIPHPNRQIFLKASIPAGNFEHSDNANFDFVSPPLANHGCDDDTSYFSDFQPSLQQPNPYKSNSFESTVQPQNSPNINVNTPSHYSTPPSGNVNFPAYDSYNLPPLSCKTFTTGVASAQSSNDITPPFKSKSNLLLAPTTVPFHHNETHLMGHSNCDSFVRSLNPRIQTMVTNDFSPDPSEKYRKGDTISAPLNWKVSPPSFSCEPPPSRSPNPTKATWDQGSYSQSVLGGRRASALDSESNSSTRYYSDAISNGTSKSVVLPPSFEYSAPTRAPLPGLGTVGNILSKTPAQNAASGFHLGSPFPYDSPSISQLHCGPQREIHNYGPNSTPFGTLPQPNSEPNQFPHESPKQLMNGPVHNGGIPQPSFPWKDGFSLPLTDKINNVEPRNVNFYDAAAPKYVEASWGSQAGDRHGSIAKDDRALPNTTIDPQLSIPRLDSNLTHAPSSLVHSTPDFPCTSNSWYLTKQPQQSAAEHHDVSFLSGGSNETGTFLSHSPFNISSDTTSELSTGASGGNLPSDPGEFRKSSNATVSFIPRYQGSGGSFSSSSTNSSKQKVPSPKRRQRKRPFTPWGFVPTKSNLPPNAKWIDLKDGSGFKITFNDYKGRVQDKTCELCGKSDKHRGWNITRPHSGCPFREDFYCKWPGCYYRKKPITREDNFHRHWRLHVPSFSPNSKTAQMGKSNG